MRPRWSESEDFKQDTRSIQGSDMHRGQAELRL